MLRPSFTLTTEVFESTSAAPVGGPDRFHVIRGMDGAADSLTFDLQDGHGLAPGGEITLMLGHDGEEALVFTGHVAHLATSIAGLRVQALGTADALMALREAAAYEAQSAGAIVRDLADRAGLDHGTIDDGPELPVFYVDARRSTHAQIVDLARALGFELFTSTGGALHFRALGAAADLDSGLGGGLSGAADTAAAAVGSLLGGAETYRYAEHAIAARQTASVPAWDAVHVGGESPSSTLGDGTGHWLTANETDFVGTAGSEGREIRFVDSWARTQDLAARVAAGRLVSMTRGARQIRLAALGRPELELGQDVTAEGFTQGAINGSGHVRRIEHRFGADWGFITRFTATGVAPS